MTCSVIHGVLTYSYHFVKEIVEIVMKTGYNAMVLHLQETEKEKELR